MKQYFILFLLVFQSMADGNAQSSENPNVLLILADDLGSIDLNCYGALDLATPNLDRLAQRGVRFTQFYAGAPVCSPSRASLLTGKTNLSAGMPGNVPVPAYDPEHKAGLPSSQVTIAEMLKENDYRTALIGKWHLGHSLEKLPNGQGFDYFFGHQSGCIDNYSHFFYWSGPNKHDLYRNSEEVHYPGRFFLDLMVDEIEDIVDQSSTDPFFIYWAINVPHYPYQGSEKWLEYYKDLPTPRREYAAFVSTMDEGIGKVLDKLESAGIDENTLVIFQSDHGHSYEERAFYGGGNSGPYRGGKFSMFEGGLRVPAIISWPNVIPQNEVRSQLTTSMDWLPTIAHYTDSEIIDKDIDGKNMVSIINNPNAKTKHEVVHWQKGEASDLKSGWAVRKGDWKLLGHPIDSSVNKKLLDSDTLFLVNLIDDIGERQNLKNKYPEKVDELLKEHQRWLATIENH